MTLPDRFSLLAARAAAAAHHAPAFAERLAAAGLVASDLSSPAGLARLPVLSKEALMRRQAAEPPFAGYLAAPMTEVAHVFVSPGPICEPVLADDSTGMGMDRMFAAAGLGPGDLALNTWSYHLVPAGLLFDRGLRAVGAGVIPAGPGQSELQAELIDRLRPTAFLGSAPFFETVAAQYRQRHGTTAGHWSLRHAFLAGEPGDWATRRRQIEAAHGIAVHCCYGTADLGLVGYEARGEPGYLIHPERLVQICDPASGAVLPVGQTGQIVVTTLAPGWPMIRFGTGDLAQATVLDTDGFTVRMGPVLGRVGSGVKVREIFVYPDHLVRLASELAPGTEIRARVERAAGRDIITAEITGPPVDPEQLQTAFRRITRLRLDRHVQVEAFTFGLVLQDVRHVPPPDQSNLT